MSPQMMETLPSGIAPLVVSSDGSSSAPAIEDGLKSEGVFPSSLGIEVDPRELVELCALDHNLYNRTFFPNTFRQKSPAFHLDIYKNLESRQSRFFAAKVFRGGAKTTVLRVHTSKRIAFGTSRTILFVGKSQDHAVRSVNWIKRAVEYNRPWAQLFGLSKGKKWSEEVAEIQHKVLDQPITLLAFGMTGAIRGINIDDYRPDLIVVDDSQDEETAATPEQRKKQEDLLFGSLAQSLAPEVDCADAKLALLQTPLHSLDLLATCEKDPTFLVSSYGVLDENDKSVWEERYPTKVVLAERASYANRGQLVLWLREKMCKIVAQETSMFKEGWLEYWDVLPPRMAVVLAIDPVPPPSEREIAMGLSKKDYEAIVAVGVANGEYFLLDYAFNHGHTPEWTITKFFEFLDKWKPLKVRVEGIAYQRTLKWILEKEMIKRGRFVQINAESDRRSKSHRINQALSGIASNKRFKIHRTHLEFRTQFVSYPNVEHEDILDAVAFGMEEASTVDYGGEGDEENQKPLPKDWRPAP